jgi:hypothetical protein
MPRGARSPGGVGRRCRRSPEGGSLGLPQEHAAIPRWLVDRAPVPQKDFWPLSSGLTPYRRSRPAAPLALSRFNQQHNTPRDRWHLGSPSDGRERGESRRQQRPDLPRRKEGGLHGLFSTTGKVTERAEYRHVVPRHPPLCDLAALNAEHRPEIKFRFGTRRWKWTHWSLLGALIR